MKSGVSDEVGRTGVERQGRTSTVAEQTGSIRLESRGIAVSTVPEESWTSCCFPAVCASVGGRWWIGFRGAATKGGNEQGVYLTWSDDRGRNWREPASPFGQVEVGGKSGRFRTVSLTSLKGGELLATLCWVDTSVPSRPFFNEATEGLLDCKLFTSLSKDDGETWSTPMLVDTGRYRHQPTPSTGPILELSDGTWACPFELNKSYDDPAPWRHAACMVFSMDRGHGWREACVVARDPDHAVFYWDQRTSRLTDDGLLALLWTYDTTRSAYRNIHVCTSDDSGTHWSRPKDTEVPGQPSRAAEIEDGSLVMAYVDRTGQPRIAVRRSFDRGITWPKSTELFLTGVSGETRNREKHSMRDAWTEMTNFSLGLPDAIALPGSKVLVTYYEGPATDETAIHWALLHVEPSARKSAIPTPP